MCKRRIRKIGQRGTIAFVALLLTSFVATGATPASARVTPADRAGDGTTTVTRETHEDVAMHLPNRTAAASVANPAPSTSPAPAFIDTTTASNSWYCRSGYVCALVQYPTGRYGWWEFGFYYYGTYKLSYWYGNGKIWNFQTGGAAARLLDYYGRQLKCVPAGASIDVNWTPVWYIKLTSSRC
jgi:hypothetical protein